MPKQPLRHAILSFLPNRKYPYSPGPRGGQMLYTSGQVPWNDRGELVGAGSWDRERVALALADLEHLRVVGEQFAITLQADATIAPFFAHGTRRRRAAAAPRWIPSDG